MKNLKGFISKNSPTILSIIGATGVIITSGLTIKATIKANNLYNSLDNKEELTKKDIVKLCWKEYIPAGLSAGATIASIIGANYINQQVKASLLSAYCILQNSYMDYKRVTNELYDDADNKIRQKICEHKYDKFNIIKTDDNSQLFFDSESGTFFESTMEEMLKKESIFLETLAKCGKVSLNTWERIIGNSPLPMGNDIGWYSNDYNDINAYPDVEIIYTKDIMSNGLECIIISFSIEPDFFAL